MSRSHGTKKSPIFTRIECFRTVTQGWISQMALKRCTKLEVALKMCPIVFQGHLWNFKVTRDKKITDFDPKWAFLDYSPETPTSGQNRFEFTDGFEMMHKAWCYIDEVSYCFLRSSIKFLGHTGWKSDDLNPIGVVRLLGQSQLSNPSDLACSVVIQIWWKLVFSVTPFYGIISLQHFVHATTAQLSRHVQNFIAITWLHFGREQNGISIEFELRWKNRSWIGLQLIIISHYFFLSYFHT